MSENSLQVSLFGPMLSNSWASPSMERYATSLRNSLISEAVNVHLLLPKAPWYTKFLPSYNRFQFERFSYYPRLARQQISPVNHITDHSYGQISKSLPFDKTVITCHDLIPLQYEKDPFALAKFKESISYLKKVAMVVADSEKTSKDIIEKVNVDQDRIKVVYAGVDDTFGKLPKAEIDQYKANLKVPDVPLLLHIGNNLPYKNIENLLKSLSILKSLSQEFLFLKVGSEFTNEQKKLINELKIGERIRYLGFLPEKDLNSVYNAIDILVYPSLVEGFGFPVIEALKVGKSVVVSKDTSLEEIAGNVGHYVNPLNPESIADEINKAINLTREKKEAIEKSALSRSNLFTWQKTARELIVIYKKLK